MVQKINPMRILVRQALKWKFLKVISGPGWNVKKNMKEHLEICSQKRASRDFFIWRVFIHLPSQSKCLFLCLLDEIPRRIRKLHLEICSQITNLGDCCIWGLLWPDLGAFMAWSGGFYGLIWGLLWPVAFGVSFNLNLQSQSHWSRFQWPWQKRPRELDHRLRFEIEEMTL